VHRAQTNLFKKGVCCRIALCFCCRYKEAETALACHNFRLRRFCYVVHGPGLVRGSVVCSNIKFVDKFTYVHTVSTNNEVCLKLCAILEYHFSRVRILEHFSKL
jgi:hypothetical protein